MGGRVRRAGAGDDVVRWFGGAQRGDPVAVDGLLRAVFPTARRTLAGLLGQPELRRIA